MKGVFEQIRQTGSFAVSPGREIFGEITLKGANTSLFLRDSEPYEIQFLPGQSLLGVLHDFSKVSLIECIQKISTSHTTTTDKKSNFTASLFPHFVLQGDRHLTSEEKLIVEVSFVIDDASILFYDFDAFGWVKNPKSFIEQIVLSNQIKREIPLGPDPEIVYFTGKRQIFSADTVFGKVTAFHNPMHTFGGPTGVRIENEISINVEFHEAHTFGDAIPVVTALLKFFEVVIGRSKNVLYLNLSLISQTERPSILKVYWSMPPRRKQRIDVERPHPADVLIYPVDQPSIFSSVLGNWLARHSEWHEARGRFSASFANQNSYSVDRIIGSANMFDLLPGSAFPPNEPLPANLNSAKEECQRIFRSMPVSQERDSVLSALGRLGKSNLKSKIRYRAGKVVEKAEMLFPDLFLVTDEAVNCRNRYVHGTDSEIDYEKEFNTFVFLTDTLEFVFAASDLLEAGWDIIAWSKIPTSMSHPFGRYRIDYLKSLEYLKGLLR